ncbi:hypothetical protein QJS04_geneDACA016671 [Acorus gramineus]|uniref:Uncharacterized protein n=1 Tax=Acorus gramineus TaxID=55184 RepID=A0AAV9APN9_ACOGR|nr:hypothetical protein QJS04_geneDACA016671 [Acorus gramineus]
MRNNKCMTKCLTLYLHKILPRADLFEDGEGGLEVSGGREPAEAVHQGGGDEGSEVREGFGVEVVLGKGAEDRKWAGGGEGAERRLAEAMKGSMGDGGGERRWGRRESMRQARWK